MARQTRTFSDLDLNFIPNPATGDLPKKYDENAIKQSVKNLVLTRNYERPFHPEIGSQVKGLMFQNASPMLDAVIRKSIIDTIQNFEPRVRLLDVQVISNPDNNAVYITIIFTILNTTKPITLDIILTRTR